MKKTYTKKQITEAIAYWKKQLRAGNYKKLNESVVLNEYQYASAVALGALESLFVKPAQKVIGNATLSWKRSNGEYCLVSIKDLDVKDGNITFDVDVEIRAYKGEVFLIDKTFYDLSVEDPVIDGSDWDDIFEQAKSMNLNVKGFEQVVDYVADNFGLNDLR